MRISLKLLDDPYLCLFCGGKMIKIGRDVFRCKKCKQDYVDFNGDLKE